MEQTQKIDRIPNVWAFFMVSVAIIFDLLGFGLAFIPVAGWLMASAVGVVAFLTFFLWFTFRGAGYNSTRKVAISGGGFLVEFIPLLNALPAWTLSTSLMIMVVKGEDLFENQKNKLKLKPKYYGQKLTVKPAANDRNYKSNYTSPSTPSPVNARQNPPLTNRGFKGIASSDDTSRFIKAA
ncbi:MAG: hypothetical protein AAB513_01905 [Patescibacteria group bacterium]